MLITESSVHEGIFPCKLTENIPFINGKFRSSLKFPCKLNGRYSFINERFRFSRKFSVKIKRTSYVH